MKKAYTRIYLLMGLLLTAMCLFGQQQDSLKQSLIRSLPDSNKVKLLNQLAQTYFFSKPDTCLMLSLQAAELAKALHFPVGEFMALNMAGEILRFMGDFPRALELLFRAREISKRNKNKVGESSITGNIGFVYAELKEYRQALDYLFISKEINDQLKSDEPSLRVARAFNLSNIGNAYEGLFIMDSALYFQKQAYAYALELNQRNLLSLTLRRLGKTYDRLEESDLALQHYHQALQNSLATGDRLNLSISQIGMAEVYKKLNKSDSTLHYARAGLNNAQKVSQKLRILEASNLLIQVFKKEDRLDSVVFYQDIASSLKDSLFGPEKFRQLQVLTLKEQQRQQDLIQQQERFRNKTRLTALIAILGFVIILGGILYRNNLRKQKLNVLLETQKNEIQESFSLLKSTQAQLIQSEKMASLGELTAGIAHEIQNPLNFVNNFSEVNKELLEELKGQRSRVKDERNEDLESGILNDITENESKINLHGKRADAIVKGMLQHSQKSSGIKEPTNINVLVEEYYRLAYHSYRSKEKLSNEIKLITDLDSNLPLVNVITQDIGRALLNLYNNAFWFLSEALAKDRFLSEALAKDRFLSEALAKDRFLSEALAKDRALTNLAGFESGQIGSNLPGFVPKYTPTVTISTKNLGDKIEIRIHDNGPGIPPNIIDKIFQPFFTTKPTGQGTGLGLSLAYDIVTKGHHGTLKVSSEEGQGSEFIIQLPVSKSNI